MKKVIAALLLSGIATGASAGCIKASLAGPWQTFIADPNLGWSSCKMNVNGAGKVVGGSCRDSQGTSRVTGGKLNINGACEVSGNIYVNNVLNNIRAARMSVDRNEIEGIVTIQGASTTFSAMRY